MIVDQTRNELCHLINTCNRIVYILVTIIALVQAFTSGWIHQYISMKTLPSLELSNVRRLTKNCHHQPSAVDIPKSICQRAVVYTVVWKWCPVHSQSTCWNLRGTGVSDNVPARFHGYAVFKPCDWGKWVSCSTASCFNRVIYMVCTTSWNIHLDDRATLTHRNKAYQILIS